MSAIDSDKKQWPDPKDYGLPFVEITPIREKIEPVKTESGKPVSESEKLAATKAKKPIPLSAEPKILDEEAIKTYESIIQTLESSPIESKFRKEEKTSSWVWAVVLVGLGIISLIIWQIQASFNSNSSNPETELAEVAEENEKASEVELSPESTQAEQIQAAVNQDSISASSNSNPNISNPAETGTTIANIASGNLIRIESKADRAQYFIIVGSLPNEKLAIEQANQYFGKSEEVYLILPYDGGTNYRLAIAKFESFKNAAAKLEEIKSQYAEQLWILKY